HRARLGVRPGGTQRPLPLWERQEVQVLPRPIVAVGVQDFSEDLADLRRRLTEAERYLDLEGKRQRLAELEKEVARNDLWDDPDTARRVTTQYGRLKDD